MADSTSELTAIHPMDDKDAHKPKKGTSWKTKFIMVLLVVIMCCLCSILGYLLLVFRINNVEGTSMEPTYTSGAKVLSIKGSFARGDVVIYNQNRLDLIHRIVAVPGDSVEFKDNGKVIINGVEEKTLIGEHAKGDTVLPVGSSLSSGFTVPAGKYLLLGDNRSLSLDSRKFGLVDEADIWGKAVLNF